MNETDADTTTDGAVATDGRVADDPRIADHHLRIVAAGLAFVVAIVHLFHPTRGLPRLAEIALYGWEHLTYDPRPLLFVLSGAAIIVGVNLAVLGLPRKPIYALGIVTMVTYVVGYFGWHVGGHGGFLPGRPASPIDETGVGYVEYFAAHLLADPWVFTAVVSELVLVVLLVELYRRER